MKRKIQFNTKKQRLMGIYLSIGGALFGLFLYQVAFTTELNYMSFVYPFLAGISHFFADKNGADKRLTIDNGEFYLHGLIAALRYRRPLLWRPHVRVTSLTKSGYYRIRVYKGDVSEEDWRLLVSECT
ncbi:hypothetical protein KP803_17200 [Vibrio sp. ZSDE26]|uniref:Uncharacterized protein n=1 Tax=Vibrio amylolyticus TaxID=2847292 RepID=A0A9X1XPY3_9VIBR|nr:hypothetical protein [Vibrio amylolyticus]MCK6265018.1 hypothetical protein [Vibrio amylolyticus]